MGETDVTEEPSSSTTEILHSDDAIIAFLDFEPNSDDAESGTVRGHCTTTSSQRQAGSQPTLYQATTWEPGNTDHCSYCASSTNNLQSSGHVHQFKIR